MVAVGPLAGCRRKARQRARCRGGFGRRDATRRRLRSRCDRLDDVPISIRKDCRPPKRWFIRTQFWRHPGQREWSHRTRSKPIRNSLWTPSDNAAFSMNAPRKDRLITQTWMDCIAAIPFETGTRASAFIHVAMAGAKTLLTNAGQSRNLRRGRRSYRTTPEPDQG
jgi:hypothetical protein